MVVNMPVRFLCAALIITDGDLVSQPSDREIVCDGLRPFRYGRTRVSSGRPYTGGWAWTGVLHALASII